VVTRVLPTRAEVLAILDGVMDPEVPVLSVRELGIVRDVSIDDTGSVTVTVTPTYSGCPAIQVIEGDIVSAIHAAGMADVRIVTTYAPAWTSDWIAPEARAKLKAYGIAPPSPAESSGLV
jgi:ring-1,2-phenylacetyl-CoA epoxidase subunit PaaD